MISSVAVHQMADIRAALLTYATPTSALVLTALSLLTYVAMGWRRPKGIPPGPPSVPILGSVPFIDYKNFNLECIRLAKKYGDIFSMYFGSKLVVVLNNFENIREAFVTKGIECGGRAEIKDPRMADMNPYHPIHGITYSSYSAEWKRQRHHSLCILRSLGWGRSPVEQHIKDECHLLVQNFRKQNGQPFAPNSLIGVSVSNVICGLLFGNRYDHDDADFLHLLNLVDIYFNNRFASSDSVHIPLLRLRKSYRESSEMLRYYSKGMFAFAKRKIEEARERLDEEGEPRDFVTFYLKEVEKAKKGDSSGNIQEDWLGPIIRDFFNAGTETSGTTLSWLLLYMAAYPEVQEKLQNQIDEVFGKGDHQFLISDKERLPYLEAVIMETQRLSSIAPFAIPHRTMAEVKLADYVIPENTIVLANLYSSSIDERLWENPLEYNPDRFIDAEGKVSRPEHWTPYSMGRRMCLGEVLARQELILFTSHLLNTFRFRFDPEHPAPSLDADYAGVRKPKPFKVIAEPRF